MSVIIPSFNHGRYITDTLRSLERQTLRDFEVIVVDDGSDDDSRSVIREFIARSGLDITLVEQANAGAHAAIERGIRVGNGSHIAILNSDDLYDPGRLSAMMRRVPSSGPYLAFSEVDWMDEAGDSVPNHAANVWYRSILSETAYDAGLGFTLLRGNISISTSNFLFSRAMHELVGPFRRYVTVHDLDFALRCTARCEPIFVRQPLLRYRLHPKSTLVANRDLEPKEVRQIFEDYVQVAASRPPQNPQAPGSRDLALFSSYFVYDRHHWFEPRTGDEPFRRLANELRTVPASSDAQALRQEVARLSLQLEHAAAEVSESKVELATLRGQLDQHVSLLASFHEDGLVQSHVEELTTALQRLLALRSS